MIYIVCNADKKTGLGHLLRCISLASQLKRLSHSVKFAGYFSDDAQGFLQTFNQRYQQSSTASIPTTLLSLPQKAKVVLDSYDYTDSDLLSEQRYVLIDDFCRLTHYPVAGVVNFTINAVSYDYIKKGAKSQVLGLTYFLPHPALEHKKSIFNPSPKHILIMVGSGDPYNLVSKLIKALNTLKQPLSIQVLGTGSLKVKSVHKLDILPLQQNINSFYQKADMLITSGGLAKYEAAFMHKPAVVFSQTQSELDETQQFFKAGLCFDFGHVKEFDGTVFAQDFEELMINSTLRERAFQKSQQAFSTQESQSAANYVLDCFDRVVD